VDACVLVGGAGLEAVGAVEYDFVELELVDEVLVDVGFRGGFGAVLRDDEFVLEEDDVLLVHGVRSRAVLLRQGHHQFLCNRALVYIYTVVNLVMITEYIAK